MSKAEAAPNLYADLVGPAWDELSPAVYKAHLQGETMQAKAIFRIQRGRNPLARLLATLGRLPAESDAAPVKLSVRRVPEGEVWDRQFGNTRLVSTQVDAGDGLLGERFGLMKVHFRFSVSDGTLSYATHSACLTPGGLHIPIPKALAPQILAVESAASDGISPHIFVSVSAPPIGLLVSYEGDLDVE